MDNIILLFCIFSRLCHIANDHMLHLITKFYLPVISKSKTLWSYYCWNCVIIAVAFLGCEIARCLRASYSWCFLRQPDKFCSLWWAGWSVAHIYAIASYHWKPEAFANTIQIWKVISELLLYFKADYVYLNVGFQFSVIYEFIKYSNLTGIYFSWKSWHNIKFASC